MPRLKRSRHRRPGPHSYLPSLHNHGGDVRLRRGGLDELGVARCPLCTGPLVARLGRAGPYWFCRCGKRQPRLAA